MVTAIKYPPPTLRIISRPRILEMAGLAGAGKSTLALALCQRNKKITIGAEIAFRKVEQVPIFARSVPLILSLIVAGFEASQRWTWDEIKFMVYLKSWSRILEQQAKTNPGTILLDHGPVFKMATLHAFGPAWLRSTSAKTWWSELFQQWADLLDLIVWLEAPDSLLETRINTRKQKHKVKGKTASEMMQFLASYRDSYNYVLSGLVSSNRLNVIKFDTSQASIDEIAEDIMAACRLEPETVS